MESSVKNHMEMQIIRSDRRSIAIEILPDLQVLVRAPKRMPMGEIKRFVSKKSEWIEKHRKLAAKRKEEAEAVGYRQRMSSEETEALARRAKQVIPERVARYAPLVGVDYGRITIRKQKTRWGSCSSKGNLNFNCLLMLAPPEVVDYVVVHELCHRLEMNHSPRFWAQVERVFPDYKTAKKWLKAEGSTIIRFFR